MLSAHVAGEGEPLVLLEGGLGAESDWWNPVAEAVSAFTRVCFYDRAGRGASDAAAKPRQPRDLVADARRVATAAGAKQPVVLVGQSLGGLIARLYAHAHPDEVAAVVLVDSMHPEQFDKCARLFPAPAANEPAMLQAMRGFWGGGWRDPANNPEGIDLQACLAAASGISTLGSIPLRVLTAGSFIHAKAPFGDAGAPLQAVWDELQGRLARLSTDASRESVIESGHFMQVDRPEAIVRAIRELVEAARSLSA